MKTLHHLLSYLPYEELFPRGDKYIKAIRLRFLEQLDCYINRHNKVFIVWFNTTFPKDYEMDFTFPYASRFSQKLYQYFQRNKCDPLYSKVREQQNSIHPHYHYGFMLDGNKIQEPFRVTEKAKELWASALGLASAHGLVHYEGAVMLRHYSEDLPDALKFVIRKLNYMAKKYSKGPKNDGIRNFGCSRIPKAKNTQTAATMDSSLLEQRGQVLADEWLI